jgi:hypothetical protein
MLRVPLLVRNGLGVICGPKNLNDEVAAFLSAILRTWNFVKFYIDCFSFYLALPPHSGPRPLTQFRDHFSQTVGLLGRVISPSPGRYLNTGQHKHRTNAYSVVLVRKRTIPTKRPPHVGEVSANFCG